VDDEPELELPDSESDDEFDAPEPESEDESGLELEAVVVVDASVDWVVERADMEDADTDVEADDVPKTPHRSQEDEEQEKI
jgi:hypothetical protein